jgi:hypothetical protein
MRAVNAADELTGTLRFGGEMKDWRALRHEEDAASRVICYLLGALSIGICVALLVIVERLR